jgi:hypothetical protein
MLGRVLAALRELAQTRAIQAVRIGLLTAALLLGSFLLATWVNKFYALKDWLVWRYGGYWLGALLLTLTCQVVGMPIVSRLGKDFRWSERLLFAQVLGMIVFSSCMFGLGMLGLFYRPLFWLVPLVLLALGARSSLRFARRFWRLRRVMYRRPRAPASPLRLLAWGFGIFSLILLYSQIIHPLNSSFDARWYHLSLAEQYTARGTILRYPNGSFVNVYPQLATLLYTWAFLAPGAELFDRVGLCSHMV